MGLVGGFLAAVLLAGLLMGATGAQPLGSAERGRELARTRNCLQCHSINAAGGVAAPDLTETVVRGFSPNQLASAMWNHLPAMSAAYRQKALSWPEMSEQDWADLFLYLYASRYFEGPGNAGRGLAVFRAGRCGECHGMRSPARAGIRPVSDWPGLSDAISLAQGMLNHRPEMERALAAAAIPHSRLSPQGLTDLLAYLRGAVPRTGQAPELAPGSPERGREVLEARGCQSCHTGSRSIEDRPTRHTLMEFVSALWNHPHQTSPKAGPMSYPEMRDLVGYLLATQFTMARGDQANGARVWSRKGCAACHDQPAGGVPPRAGMAGRMNSLVMLEAIWRHGPRMQERMRGRGLDWPRINSQEMGDLIAYLRGSQLRRRPQAATWGTGVREER